MLQNQDRRRVALRQSRRNKKKQQNDEHACASHASMKIARIGEPRGPAFLPRRQADIDFVSLRHPLGNAVAFTSSRPVDKKWRSRPLLKFMVGSNAINGRERRFPALNTSASRRVSADFFAPDRRHLS
jgi:hypothetical protein